MITFVVDALAAHRLTRLVCADEITDPLRSFVIAQAYELAGRARATRETMPYSTWTERAHDDPEAPRLARLLVCRWCAGWWISLAVAWLRWRHPRLWRPIAHAAACSSAAGLLARLEH